MNSKQQNIINNIFNGYEQEIIVDVFDYFLDKGLGSVSKSETEIFLFHLIDTYKRKNDVKLSNYELSSFLKVSERKIKNLRLEVGIRYHSNNKDDENNLWLKFFELLAEGYIEYESLDSIILTIEDPYLLRFIEHTLKSNKQPSIDYKFNRERIILKSIAFKTLVKIACTNLKDKTNAMKLKATIKKAKWGHIGEQAKKELFEIVKSII
ncbi:MAG: hypothetical protein FGM46_09940, partial [Ferruginibacter sp.]|nr:hypothetical protein [Ferruginibacter sp.]